MSLESSLEEERLKVLEVLGKHEAAINETSGQINLDTATLKDLSKADGIDADTTPRAQRPSHRHTVSLILNDGDEEVVVSGSPHRIKDEYFDDKTVSTNGSHSPAAAATTSTISTGNSVTTNSRQQSTFTAESLFHPIEDDDEVLLNPLDKNDMGGIRGRSRSDASGRVGSYFEGTIGEGYYARRRLSQSTTNNRGRPRIEGRSPSPNTRLPMDRINDEDDYDYTDDDDEEEDSDDNYTYDEDGREGDEEEEEEEEEDDDDDSDDDDDEDIDSSETSDDDEEKARRISADIIKNKIDSAKHPPGFKEGSALTGPVLSNSNMMRNPSDLDASLMPTNTMSLLAAIEAEQQTVSTLTGIYDSSKLDKLTGTSPKPASPKKTQIKQHKQRERQRVPRPQRALSPQQVEYAAYKRRIIHPNTAFDAASISGRLGSDIGGFLVDVPYTSDHEEVRDAQRAAQLHIEISQIHSNTETRRMFRTMVRGNLEPLGEEPATKSAPNLGDMSSSATSAAAPLKSFIVATDLSPEATHALEWTIGTVLRDGNLLIIVCAFEEDGAGDAQAEEAARLEAMDKITATTVKLLKKTRLQVHVVMEVLHCKSARHTLTDITDHVSPTLVILGSRGRSALKGVLLGSFSNYIVERSSVPVMVARRKLQKAKNSGLNVRLANNLRHGTLSTAKID